MVSCLLTRGSCTQEKIKKERKLTGFEAPEKPDMPLALAGATIQEEDEYDEDAEDDDFE